MKASMLLSSTLAVLTIGCASTQIDNRQVYDGPRQPRPTHVVVHDFAATLDDMPAFARREYAVPPGGPQLEGESLAAARQLGSSVARHLVDRIEAMGMPSVRASDGPSVVPGDLVITGYFQELDAGSRAERLTIGFGKGQAEIAAQVDGYLVQDDGGLRKVGSGTVDSGGSKTPGVLVPLAVTVATANPVGLVVGGAVKATGEITGSSTLEGNAKRTADKIADELQAAFRRQGWID